MTLADQSQLGNFQNLGQFHEPIRINIERL